jgi:hypothetical protein
MPKHDKNVEDTGENNIGGQPGLVGVDSTQRPMKNHEYSQKILTFSPKVRPSAA